MLLTSESRQSSHDCISLSGIMSTQHILILMPPYRSLASKHVKSKIEPPLSTLTLFLFVSSVDVAQLCSFFNVEGR